MNGLRFVSTDKLLIAGPCSAESREMLMSAAGNLVGYPNVLFRAGLWKPRTRPSAFEGVGKEGLAWLSEVRKMYGLKVCTEVASAEHVELCLKSGVDALWIGARTTGNPFSMQEIAEALSGTDIPIFIKNPLNPDLKLWIGAIERLQKNDCLNVHAIHRGFSLADNGVYRQSPLWQIPIELRRLMPEMKILCDPSHIAGKREFVFGLAQTAMNLCFDGLMVEMHPCPEKAKTDAEQQLTPEQLYNLIAGLKITREEDQRQTDLELLREKIDKIDTEIIGLLGERMQISRQVSRIKKEKNMSVLQINRWDKLLKERMQQAEKRGLRGGFVKEIFEQIHEESVSIQDEMLKEDK